MTPEILDADVQAVTAWMANRPDTKSVASFVPGPGIQKLALSFDIQLLRQALDECLSRSQFQGDMQDQGFAALPLTQGQFLQRWPKLRPMSLHHRPDRRADLSNHVCALGSTRKRQ